MPVLETLQIANWKAFKQRTFRFEPGLNLFIGPNGSGKTTILEAICVALAGAARTADFRTLVRDKKREAEIELTLRLNGHSYLIGRKFSADRIISADLLINGIAYPSPSWDAVSSRISEELQTDPSFLSRVVYMSEGELFEYLKNPPQKALNNAIRRVLGVENLQALAEFFAKTQKDFEKLAASLRSDLGRPAPEGRDLSGDPKAQFEEIEKARAHVARLEGEAKLENERLQFVRAELNDLEKLKSHVDAFETASKAQGLGFDRKQPLLRNTSELVSSTFREAEALEAKLEDLTSTQGALSNTIRYFEDILKLLLPLVESSAKEGVACPVCRRPIDARMAQQLTEETRAHLDRTKREARDIGVRTEETKRILNNVRRVSQQLATLRAQIDQEVPPALSSQGPFTSVDFESYHSKLKTQFYDATTHLDGLQGTVREQRKSIDDLSTKLAAIESAKREADLREKLTRRLVQAYKGLILCSITGDALEKTLGQRRDVGLGPLYAQIAELWQKFRPENKWAVSFDEEGRIALQFDSRRLNFSQLSGGEKMVLLLIARVLMCSMFSNVDFLTIDEPLEHLDTRNRRSIINFLVASSMNGLISQTIVTTFEESLVRKYLDHKGTKTVYLPMALTS
jgi:exonuclease SbcC